MRTIVKKELAERICEKFDFSTNVGLKVVQFFLDQVISEINQGNRIELRNFGVLEVRDRKSRVARNPRTGEKVMVPQKRTVIFKPGKSMNPNQQVEDGSQRFSPDQAEFPNTL